MGNDSIVSLPASSPLTSGVIRSRYFTGRLSSEEPTTATTYGADNAERYQQVLLHGELHYRWCFDDYLSTSKPPSDMGLPGDIWIDTTPGFPTLHAKMRDGEGWALWAGLEENDTLEHPFIKDRFLWLTSETDFGWATHDHITQKPKRRRSVSSSTVVAHVLAERHKKRYNASHDSGSYAESSVAINRVGSRMVVPERSKPAPSPSAPSVAIHLEPDVLNFDNLLVLLQARFAELTTADTEMVRVSKENRQLKQENPRLRETNIQLMEEIERLRNLLVVYTSPELGQRTAEDHLHELISALGGGAVLSDGVVDTSLFMLRSVLCGITARELIPKDIAYSQLTKRFVSGAVCSQTETKHHSTEIELPQVSIAVYSDHFVLIQTALSLKIPRAGT